MLEITSSFRDKRAGESDDDDDSIDWGSDSDETTSSSDDEGKYESLVERFLKKNTQKEGDEKKLKRVKKKDDKDRAKKQLKDDEDEQDGEGWTQVKGGSAITAVSCQAKIKKTNQTKQNTVQNLCCKLRTELHSDSRRTKLLDGNFV
jgi:hypothetical protein